MIRSDAATQRKVDTMMRELRKGFDRGWHHATSYASLTFCFRAWAEDRGFTVLTKAAPQDHAAQW